MADIPRFNARIRQPLAKDSHINIADCPFYLCIEKVILLSELRGSDRSGSYAHDFNEPGTPFFCDWGVVKRRNSGQVAAIDR